MRTVTRVLIASALALGLGCARTDWIDRTLVTVDVTGKWAGKFAGGSDVQLELEQKGSTVKGLIRYSGGATAQSGRFQDGPLEGTVTGDVLHFRDTRGGLEGELTVNGDQMDGMVYNFGQRRLSLQRVDSSSPPGSPPR